MNFLCSGRKQGGEKADEKNNEEQGQAGDGRPHKHTAARWREPAQERLKPKKKHNHDSEY